jgi:hypothetical protein
MSKFCSHCKQNLDISCFAVDPHGVYGVESICKKCRGIIRRIETIKNKERLQRRPISSDFAVKKKCPICRKYVYVEPEDKTGT